MDTLNTENYWAHWDLLVQLAQNEAKSQIKTLNEAENRNLSSEINYGRSWIFMKKPARPIRLRSQFRFLISGSTNC